MTVAAPIWPSWPDQSKNTETLLWAVVAAVMAASLEAGMLIFRCGGVWGPQLATAWADDFVSRVDVEIHAAVPCGS